MIDLNSKVSVELNLVTLGSLISGLYTTFSEVSLFAIPTEMFMELAIAIYPFLKNWDYSKISFEDWVRQNLLIYPIEMFSQLEYEDAKSNDIFIERRYGNSTLIATANMGR